MLKVFDDCANENYQRIVEITDEKTHRIDLSQRTDSPGQIIESDGEIIVENVPVVTPTGDIIVESLSLKVRLINSMMKTREKQNEKI